MVAGLYVEEKPLNLQATGTMARLASLFLWRCGTSIPVVVTTIKPVITSVGKCFMALIL